MTEAAAGAAAGGANGQGTGDPAGGGSAQPNGGAGEAFWTKYDLPDGLKGASAPEAYDRLYNGWKGLRDKEAQRVVPKNAGEYTFDPADKIKPYFKKGADDPLLGVARETAHKHQFTNTQFGAFLNDLFTTAVEKNILPPLFDPAKEIETLGSLIAADKTGDDRKRAVEAALHEAEAFAPVLAQSLKLSDGAGKLLREIAGEAAGVELLRALKAGTREFGLQPGGQGAPQGGYSQADFDRDLKDERYNPFSPKYDKAWRDSVDAKARTLFGGPPLPG